MDQITLARFVFGRNLWLFDWVVCTVLGVSLGYLMQREVSSDWEDPRNLLLLSIAVGFISYLLPLAIGSVFRKSLPCLPSWIWIAVLGSLLFAIGHGAVLFAWKGVTNTGGGEQLQQMVSLIFTSTMIGKLVKGFALISAVFLLALFAARLFAFVAIQGYRVAARTSLKL